MKQDDIITLKIEALTADASGIGHSDGYAVFVPYVIAGETVRVKITYAKKNVAYGKLLEVTEPSPQRVAPECPVYGKCGGCRLSHMTYEAQLGFKRDQFVSIMKKNGGVDIAPDLVFGSPEPFRYRNKLVLPVSQFKGRPEFGFYAENSRNIVPIGECPLLGNWAKLVISAVSEYMTEAGERGYDHAKTHKGDIRHISARFIDDSLLLTLVTNNPSGLKNPELLYSILEKKFKDSPVKIGLSESINTSDSGVILGKTVRHLLGISRIESSAAGIRFSLAPSSFFQVNGSVFGSLYEDVLAHVAKTDVLIDAYSGIGILTAMLSSPDRDTYGVELNPEATRDADEILKLNNCPRQTNINGDATKILPELFEKNRGKSVTLVVDPVRKGLSEETCGLISRLKPEKFVYVSCNAATQARDLGRILTNYPDFRIEYSAVYDQFPQTASSESLVVLSRKQFRPSDL